MFPTSGPTTSSRSWKRPARLSPAWVAAGFDERAGS